MTDPSDRDIAHRVIGMVGEFEAHVLSKAPVVMPGDAQDRSDLFRNVVRKQTRVRPGTIEFPDAFVNESRSPLIQSPAFAASAKRAA